MSSFLEKVTHTTEFETRLGDMRVLLGLEAKCLSNKRLSVREVITLQTLREFYPGSAARIRNELLISDGDHEDLLLFVLNKEDRHLFVPRENTEGHSPSSSENHRHDNPDCDP